MNFNTQANQGGSVFSPDGSVLYSAFNIAPVQTPAARANVGQLMLNDPDNLLIRLGIQMPENLTGRLVLQQTARRCMPSRNPGSRFFRFRRFTTTRLPFRNHRWC